MCSINISTLFICLKKNTSYVLKIQNFFLKLKINFFFRTTINNKNKTKFFSYYNIENVIDVFFPFINRSIIYSNQAWPFTFYFLYLNESMMSLYFKLECQQKNILWLTHVRKCDKPGRWRRPLIHISRLYEWRCQQKFVIPTDFHKILLSINGIYLSY